MRKIIFAFLFLFSLGLQGQELPNLKNIKLNKKASYKHAETTVSKVVDPSSVPDHIRKKMPITGELDITDDVQEQLKLVNG